MLHPYQIVSKRRVLYTGLSEEPAPEMELLALLCSIDVWLDTAPAVYGSAEGKMVYILYENTAFLIDDFLENFAPSMAVVSKTWPVCAFGTASNQETVRLSAVISREHRTDTAEGDFIELVQQSISGKEADDLQTLCLQVECPEHETAEKLAYLLGCVNWRTSIAVIPWSKMSVLSMQRLVDPNIRSFFCYIGADSCMAPDDFLRSLNFPQKVALWRAFLRERLEPAEFEWLEEEITEHTVSNRMEWELALREAMEQLQFRVINRENAFQLFDGAGNRLYFSADCRSSAERVLLKILFPLNFQ